MLLDEEPFCKNDGNYSGNTHAHLFFALILTKTNNAKERRSRDGRFNALFFTSSLFFAPLLLWEEPADSVELLSWFLGKRFHFLAIRAGLRDTEESLHRGDRLLRGISVTSLFPVSVCVPTVPLKWGWMQMSCYETATLKQAEQNTSDKHQVHTLLTVQQHLQ